LLCSRLKTLISVSLALSQTPVYTARLYGGYCRASASRGVPVYAQSIVNTPALRWKLCLSNIFLRHVLLVYAGEDPVDQERTGGAQSTTTSMKDGLSWEEAEVAALDRHGWPHVSSWMRDESRSTSRSRSSWFTAADQRRHDSGLVDVKHRRAHLGGKLRQRLQTDKNRNLRSAQTKVDFRRTRSLGLVSTNSSSVR